MPAPLPSIASAARQIRTGEITPLDLVEQAIERVRQVDERIAAWVHLDVQAVLDDGRRLSELAARGELLGPLHGIPIGIKDIIDVAGVPTVAGSPLRTDHVAQYDAPVVGKLREAGAILFGKTVTTELACFDPAKTHNPWNAKHTPGGSSSGSAAAVAAGIVPAALGTQTGGSIIRPAAYCGVCGSKPTFAAVSLGGVVPVSPRLDHLGPIAGSVADLQAVFDVIRSQRSGESVTETPPRRIGVLRGYFEQRADNDVWTVVEVALEELAKHPIEIVDVELPESFREVHAMHRRIMAADAAKVHGQALAAHRDKFGPNVRSLILEGEEVSVSEYQQAVDFQQSFTRQMNELLSSVDVALTAATPSPAPASLRTTGDPSFNSPFSFSGVPVVSLPGGLSRGGMPCGIQLIGPQHADDRLLALARWVERVIAFEHRPSP